MKPIAFDLAPGARKSVASQKPDEERRPAPALPPAAPAESASTEKALANPTREDRVGILPRSFRLDTWASSLAQEQIHALATHVLARHSEQGMKAVALTSALAGEGKTTVTLALAEKLASSGKKILVIDLDTHRGTLSQQAKLDGLPGAIESTNRPAASTEPAGLHVYPTDCAGLFVTPTGRVESQEGLPLLSPDRIKRMVQLGLENHDLVLLDCPPLLPVADTHVVGEAVDSAILVIRAGSTPQLILTQALEEFGREKFFAAVLNRAQPHMIPYFREVYGYYRRGKAKPAD